MRVVLKVSGESLRGKLAYGVDESLLNSLVEVVISAIKADIEVAVVIGGGNIFRARDLHHLKLTRSSKDYMGMLSTILNGLVVADLFRNVGFQPLLLSGIALSPIVHLFSSLEGVRHLQKKQPLILVGGSGNTHFTTDTAAALRAAELEADLILKATRVDGVYDRDPILFSDAKRLERVSYEDALSMELKVMDATAFALCREENIPIYICRFQKLLEIGISQIISEPTFRSIVGSQDL